MSCGQTVSAEQRLSDRLLQATLHALELNGVYLGKRLGLYEALHAAGTGLTPAQLAGAAGIAERYAREWLEQQAVAGLLGVENASAPSRERRYVLPPEHAAVLVDDDNPSHVAPLAQMVAGIGAALPRVVEAYRTGAGVPYEAYGVDFRHGQAGINRPAFVSDLTERWLPAVADVHARLLASERPRIADVGCGAGWSTIALARAYPHADVIGYDADAASIAEARRHAEENGVSVRFVQADAAALAGEAAFDLALVLEALHDMAQPVRVLAAIRSALAPAGTVLIADEKVADRFYAPGDEIERLMYGWSIVHCLPVALTETPSAAIGTAIRPETVMSCAASAGFTRAEVLQIESGFFRFYRLDAA